MIALRTARTVARKLSRPWVEYRGRREKAPLYTSVHGNLDPGLHIAFTATQRNGPLQDFLAELGIATCVERARFEQRCPALFHETEFLDA